MTRARALACALLLAACRSDGGAAAAVSDPSDAAPARPAAESAPRIAPQRRGVPHAGNIDFVAVSRDGSAAVSRDHLGGVRVWPALDGSREPLVLPLRGARDLAIEVSRGPGGERELRVAAAGGAGYLRVVAVAEDGSVRELPAPTPQLGARQVELLPGGATALALGADHRVVLVDEAGRELAALQKRRFRPDLVLASEDGTRAVAFERSGDDALAYRIAVDAAAPSLRLVGEPIELANLATIARGRAALSPDGRRLAFFATPPPDADPATPPPSSGAVAIVELASGARRDVPANVPATGHRALGFSADDLVMASASPVGGTWAIDTGDGRAMPRLAPVDLDAQHGADAFARGVRVGADGTWLYVERAGAPALYLGFERFQPIAAAISPSGEHAAWVSVGGVVHVVPVGGGATVRLTPAPLDQVVRVAFVDEEHLVTATNLGGLSLVHWPSQTTVATANAGGPVNEIEGDPARGLLRVTRSPQGTVLFEVGDEGFSATHVVADGSYRAGFLAGDEVLWTLDSQNVLRRYRLGELRAGLSQAALYEHGERLTAPVPVSAIDARGRVCGLVREGTATTLRCQRPGAAEPELAIATRPSPFLFVPAPDGRRLAVVDSSGLLVVHDADTGEQLWMRAFGQGGPGQVAWSGDGTRLVTGSAIGALVLDGATGEALLATCGPHFEARTTPPQTTLSVIARANLCED